MKIENKILIVNNFKKLEREILEEIFNIRFDYCILCESDKERSESAENIDIESLRIIGNEVLSDWVKSNKTEHDFLFGRYETIKDLMIH